jgi:hypothetical protein
MSSIPLDLERRCEQRRAARFLRPLASAASQKRGIKPILAKTKRKPAGLKRRA